MTDRPTDRPLASAADPSPAVMPHPALGKAVTRARWTILWERLWPALAALATTAGLFLAVSWLGAWLWLPPIGRAIGLVGFVLLALVALFPLIRFRIPSVADGLRRLDIITGLPHRPATAMADQLSHAEDDPISTALWRAHVTRALAAAEALRAGVPRPLLAMRDPYALRALVVVLGIATFFAAGGERYRRVAAAFDWQGVVAPANFRVDAWVSPPAYTGKPPIMLPGLRPGEAAQNSATTVPTGSVLVVRATGEVHLDLATTGGLVDPPAGTAAPTSSGTQERRFTIADAGSATLRGFSGGELTWRFAAIPDRPPTIELAKDPEEQGRGSLKLSYKIDDDYGVAQAQATFALKDNGAARPPHPLYGAPNFALNLPQAHARRGVGEMIKDLTENPWAGVDVVMTLTARDEAGNEGRSAPFELRLPERPFYQPLARALIEQRRDLALDADNSDRVLIALDALAMAPERFSPEAGIYLGLRAIFWQLSGAKTDDALRDVVGRLWLMAVTIEDGDVSDAEQSLRAAQDALRQALERGAPDQEIKRLMDNLRAALDKFLQAMAAEARKNPQQFSQRMDPNARMLRQQDLKSMLDRLEQMARSGAKDAARQMLDQLQQMLENLQMARPSPGDGDDEMAAELDELGDMIRKQQQLRDRTYQQGQNGRSERQRGQRGDPNAMGDLRQDQQALRDQLKKLLDQMRQRGQGQQQGQGDSDQLGRAGDAMGDAEGSLGEGNADNAVDAQARALDALRKGAQSLAQAMQQGMGPGPGQSGRLGLRPADNIDPLGRAMHHDPGFSDDTTVKVPGVGEVDVQRARRILDELRRRFGETTRSQPELDYIERLLKDF